MEINEGIIRMSSSLERQNMIVNAHINANTINHKNSSARSLYLSFPVYSKSGWKKKKRTLGSVLF